MATSFSGGRSRSARREPPTMGKQQVNFITCGCESSAPFCVREVIETEAKLIPLTDIYMIAHFLGLVEVHQ
jgi:hypothetical protein